MHTMRNGELKAELLVLRGSARLYLWQRFSVCASLRFSLVCVLL